MPPISVHRIIAFTWIPNDDPLNKTFVMHLNDTRTDNRACNLAWGSHSDNIKDAYRTGRLENERTPVRIKCCETRVELMYKSIDDARSGFHIGYATIYKYSDLGTPYKPKLKKYNPEGHTYIIELL